MQVHEVRTYRSEEPLPRESPLWTHPRITVMPHVSRRHDARDVVPRIVENLRRLKRGEPTYNLAAFERLRPDASTE